MENEMGYLADKIHTERGYQDGKRSEKMYCRIINVQQFQISQLKSNDMMTNPKLNEIRKK